MKMPQVKIPQIKMPQMQQIKMPRFSRPVLTMIFCTLAVGVAASVLFSLEQSAPANAQAQNGVLSRTITVSGEGEVTAKPDMATIFLGVVSQGATAREAMSANNARMQKVIGGLKNAGIADKDLQTSGLNVSPRYTQPKEGGDARITGYDVQNQVTARVRDLSKLGNILDQVVSLGANSMNGISFSFAEPKALVNEARRKAMADAKARAELYADAAGVGLGKVQAISENGYSRPPMPMYAARDMMMKAESSVPMEAGESALTANVTVVYAID